MEASAAGAVIMSRVKKIYTARDMIPPEAVFTGCGVLKAEVPLIPCAKGVDKKSKVHLKKGFTPFRPPEKAPPWYPIGCRFIKAFREGLAKLRAKKCLPYNLKLLNDKFKKIRMVVVGLIFLEGNTEKAGRRKQKIRSLLKKPAPKIDTGFPGTRLLN